MDIFRQRGLVQVVAVALAAGFACTPQLPDPIVQARIYEFQFSHFFPYDLKEFFPNVDLNLLHYCVMKAIDDFLKVDARWRYF